MMVNISLDAHKETQLHTDMLNKARVTDAGKQNSKASITSNGASGDNVNLDNSPSSSSYFSPDEELLNTVVNNKNKTEVITKKIRDCEPCKLYIDTNNYNAHAKGKSHQTNIDLEAAVSIVKHSNVNNNKTSKTFCKFCILFIDTHNYNSHVKGAYHKSKVNSANKNPAQNTNVNTAKTFCAPCNLYIDTHNYECHTKGVTHKHHVEIATKKDLAARDPDSGKTFCEACKVYIHTNNFQAHTEGAKHKNNLRITTVQSKIPPLITPEQPPLHEHMTTTEVTYALLCVVCSAKVPNITKSVNEHVLGKTHAAYLKIFISKLHPHLEFSNNIVSCKVCEERVHLSEVDMHINSEYHKNKFWYLLYVNKIDRINDVAFCTACFLEIEAFKEIEHVASDLHKQSMKPVCSTAQNYCTICEVKLPGGPQSFEIHVNGRPHKLKWEKKVQDLVSITSKKS